MKKLNVFEQIARGINEIEITKLKKPELRDRLAVRHGRYIEQDAKDKKTFRFEREDLGLLVDFLAELFKEEGHKLIGIRGMPRVGKTESIVAGSVCAHKRWLFISSTLIKQTVRSSLIKGEYDANHVYIIDGAVTARESCCSRETIGENGNRYVRISLALDDQKLDEAAIRLTELAYLYE